jgi:hypothetical protein
MKNCTLYTLLDVVYTEANNDTQFIATPGQCYLYGDNLKTIKNSIAGVWLYSGVQHPDGQLMLDSANGFYTKYELQLLNKENYPLAYPGGLRKCFSHTMYDTARELTVGIAKFPIFDHILGVNDFLTLSKHSLTTDSIPRLPNIYVKYSKEVASRIKAKDEDIVQLWDGSKNGRSLDTFIRTSIPILLEPLYQVAKRNKMDLRNCISAWNYACHNACMTAGNQLYIGWDPNPTYPTKLKRISRKAYEEYGTDVTCGFVTPRIRVKFHAHFDDPFKHIDKFRSAVDIAIRTGNALHVQPESLY